MRVLDRRRLNRASLHRQLLLARAELPVRDAVEHVGGLQAQAPNAPYVGLWSRVAGFRPDRLATALTDRELVRTPLLRGTVHLVTAADAVAWYPLVRDVLVRVFRTNFARRLPGVDVDELVAEGTALLRTPMTRAELGAALARDRPDADRNALAYAVTCLVPLVQVPPRGLWGRTGQATWTPTAAWTPVTATATPADLVRRCLAAFGPATVRDVRTWCGIGLGDVIAGMDLRTYRDEHGATLYDLPDAELPDPDVPAPPRFLPEYDNLLLSYADRDRVGAGHRAVPLPPGPGAVTGSVLVDGFWRANWRLHTGPARLIVEPFDRLPERNAVEAEAARLLALLAPDADRPEVVVTRP
ncbi:MAG TPA: winged helix DNA-binding domain-containing protein [Pseudonocardiaceae bacterium]|nr:winged helix DNA-binding domain-containing protein [Pseudonocardiaceae bacterium]